MAQRKKRVAVGKRKPTGRGRASVRGKGAKQTATKLRSKTGVAKAKRSRAKKVARKKARPMKPPITPVVGTTIVDVVEESDPGVVTVTEFEETEPDWSRS